MSITICGREFDNKEIQNISITDRRVTVTTEKDYIVMIYEKEEDIRQAKGWLRLQELTNKELDDAIALLTVVCDSYINTFEQCEGCPLNKKNGCIVMTIPVNWAFEGE